MASELLVSVYRSFPFFFLRFLFIEICFMGVKREGESEREQRKRNGSSVSDLHLGISDRI